MATPKFTRTCPECGLRFGTHTSRKQFCTPACGKTFNNRQLAEGQRMIGLAKAWRAARSTKDPVLKQAAKDAFSLMCRELDALNAADHVAGRLHPTKVFRRRQVAGLLDYQGPLAR